MNKLRLIVFFLILSGCSNYSIKHDTSAGDSWLLSDQVNKAGTGKDLAVVSQSNAIGGQIWDISEHFKLDSHVGVQTNKTTDGHDTLSFDLDILPRLRYNMKSGIDPYIIGCVGFSYFTKNIKEQETPWGFVLGYGIGVRKPIFENKWMYFEYRTYHESNGSEIFGSPKPNKGVNSDCLIIGIEYKF